MAGANNKKHMQAAGHPKPSRVPEALPIQEYWSKIISPGTGEIKFKGGGTGGLTVLRKDVPRHWRKVRNTKGICCTYFVKDERHFLAMVSEKELAKMKGTIGDLEMTNHAKTLAYGMKAARKRRGVPNFSVVDACFGFWFDVCNQEGVIYKFKSCANYFNHGHIATRQLAGKEEKSLLAALGTVSAIPKDSKSDSESDSESDSSSVIDLADSDNEESSSEESSSEESDSEETSSEESSSEKSDSESEPRGWGLVGKQIKVLRENNNRSWFFGNVVEFSGGKHLIHYDDGKKKKHALKNKEWKVVGKGKKPKAAAGKKRGRTKEKKSRKSVAKKPNTSAPTKREQTTEEKAGKSARKKPITAAGKKRERTTEEKTDKTVTKKPKLSETRGCQAKQITGIRCGFQAKPGAQLCGRHEPKEPEVDRICRARLPRTGERCGDERIGESRWCLTHLDRWHGEECPVWGPSPAARVPEVKDPICPAWVAATGLRCPSERQPCKGWCGRHFNAWIGKDSPVWSPVPFAVEDPICLAKVTGTGLRCTKRHQKDSRWCGTHFNACHGKDSPDW